jgi:hypothetical protein
MREAISQRFYEAEPNRRIKCMDRLFRKFV